MSAAMSDSKGQVERYEVKGWNNDQIEVVAPDGDWVRYSDHAAAIEKLEGERDAWKSRATEHFDLAQKNIKEVARLEAYIAKSQGEVSVTIADLRARDKTVEQRSRAEAAEAQVSDLKAKVEILPTWLLDAVGRWPEGTSFTVEYDGFAGEVRGWYLTEEGKSGVVGQFTGTKMCHVYNEARAALDAKSPASCQCPGRKAPSLYEDPVWPLEGEVRS